MSIIVQEMGLANTQYSMESSGDTSPDFDLLAAAVAMDGESTALNVSFNAVAGLEALTQVEGVGLFDPIANLH